MPPHHQEEALSLPAPPQRLGRYEIRRELGRGTMGVVYEAFDPALGRSVALKTVQAAFALSPAERASFERRFETEARVAAALSHPGIVVVHDVGRDESRDTLYIALELLQGDTLAERMTRGAPLPWREAVQLAVRLAEALQHAHERGIVHRDVKPANIMLLPTGEPKIMDFGIAKVPAGQLTIPGEFFGTPSYMSPEQAAGSDVDARSDIFSLGSVLFLLLTGRRAFDGPNVPAILARVAHRDPPRPSALADVPAEMDYVVARALSKAPALRYPDARSFREDLQDLLDGRAPRHRAGWVEPPRQEVPLGEMDTAREQPTAELSRHGGPLSLSASVTRQSPGTRPARGPMIALGSFAAVALLIVLARPESVFGPTATPVPAPSSSAVARPSAAPSEASTQPAATLPVRASSPALPTSPSPSPSVHTLAVWPWSPKAGRLEVDFAHGLKGGQLRVWVDDELVIDNRLQGKVTKKILFVYRERAGSLNEAIEVTPGEHTVRVQVDADGSHWSKHTSTRFESGETRRLLARLAGGFLEDKQIELAWAKPGSAS